MGAAVSSVGMVNAIAGIGARKRGDHSRKLCASEPAHTTVRVSAHRAHGASQRLADP